MVIAFWERKPSPWIDFCEIPDLKIASEPGAGMSKEG
jgi:hypothetical protein